MRANPHKKRIIVHGAGGNGQTNFCHFFVCAFKPNAIDLQKPLHTAGPTASYKGIGKQ